MIGIVDYGLGNIKAFANIFGGLDVAHVIAKTAADLDGVSHVVLPGVGAFDQAMRRLEESGMRGKLDEIVLGQKKPAIGVCVGMQMLMRSSEEGTRPGLGWLDGDVVRFASGATDTALRVPHMGWNDVRPAKAGGLFEGLENGARFYFLHSYYTRCAVGEDVLACASYGAEFACAVHHGNVYGVQFHPEKSHRFGVRLLRNFAAL